MVAKASVRVAAMGDLFDVDGLVEATVHRDEGEAIGAVALTYGLDI